jgi:hypothetical protein
MQIPLLLYSLLLPTVLGFLYITYLSPGNLRENFFLRLFLSYGAGLGMVTYFMLVLGLLNVQFSLLRVSSLLIITIFILTYLIHRKNKINRVAESITEHSIIKTRDEKMRFFITIITVFFSCWILAKIFFVILESTIWPVHAWDSWTHWSSGAKYLFYAKELSLDVNDEHFLGRGYFKLLYYPLHVPLLQVWVSLCLGDSHEVFMKIWNSFYFASLVGLMFFSIWRESHVIFAVLAAFFLSSVPLLTYHSITAYADLPLSYYSLGTAICFWQYVKFSSKNERHGRGMLILMGTFVGFSVWTKMEGLIYAGAFSIALIVFLVRKKIPWYRIYAYLIPIALISGPWYVLMLMKKITFFMVYVKQGLVFLSITILVFAVLVIIGKTSWKVSAGVLSTVLILITLFLTSSGIFRGYDIQRLDTGIINLEVLPSIWRQVFLEANFNMIFPFLILVSLFGIKKIVLSELKYLFIVLFFVIGVFLCYYITTDISQWVINTSSINRNILTFIPMTYYISALVAIKMLKPG